MDELQRNKAVVGQFFDRLSANDLDGLGELLHEDATWWVLGGELWPFSGTISKQKFLEITSQIVSVFPDGLTIEPRSFVAEGDRVAVEAEGKARTASGRDYNNVYHFLFALRDGRIILGKEYFDTLYAKAALLD